MANRQKKGTFLSSTLRAVFVMFAATCLQALPRSRVLLRSPLGVVSAFSTKSVSAAPIAKAKANGESDAIKFETKSCSPPRFDTFGDLLVGKWAIESTHTLEEEETTDDETTTTKGFVAEVKEVMRSCGGAVQGIREPATMSLSSNGGESEKDKDESSTYLNRANDGFVFFDDGCYTMGPISIEKSNKKAKEDSFLSCIVLPETDPEGRKRRLVLGYGGDDAANEEIYGAGGHLPHAATLRTKQRFGDTMGSKDEEETIDVAATLCTIQEITRIDRCRMPSEGQPWMLQRAKWETLLPIAKENEENDPESFSTADAAASNTLVRDPLFWVTSESLQDFSERFGTPDFDTGNSDGGMILVHSGVACPQSKLLRLMARQYKRNNDSFTLCGILRIEANVRFEC